MSNLPKFRTVTMMATALCLTLCILLCFAPTLIYRLFELNGSPTSDLLAKRAAMLFLGYTVLLFASRDIRAEETIKVISLTMCVTFAGLIGVGCFEYFTGTAGPGIWLAIGGEFFFIILFVAAWLNRKNNASS